jgi:hypothetical protein
MKQIFVLKGVAPNATLLSSFPVSFVLLFIVPFVNAVAFSLVAPVFPFVFVTVGKIFDPPPVRFVPQPFTVVHYGMWKTSPNNKFKKKRKR